MAASKNESRGRNIPQIELNAKFIEKSNDIKSYDEITGQIRQGEGVPPFKERHCLGMH